MKGKIFSFESRHNSHIIWRCPYHAFFFFFSRMSVSGAELIFVSAESEFEEIRLQYCFRINGRVCKVSVMTKDKGIFSIKNFFMASEFFESEINNVFGVKFAKN